MKKLISLLLVLVMCLSLCACGSSEESEELKKYRKYETLINYIEEENYQAALGELIKISEQSGNADSNGDEDPAETAEKTVKTVEITLDNWQEYFEIVEREETQTNDFDEIEDMYKSAYLVLKDGYEMVEYDTSIAVEYRYITEWRYVEVDKENGVLNIGELVPDRDADELNGLTKTIKRSETCLTDGRSWSEGMQAVPTGYEIVRIQGTLYIAE